MTYLIHELFSYFLSIFQPILSRVRRNCSLKQFPMFPFYLFSLLFMFQAGTTVFSCDKDQTPSIDFSFYPFILGLISSSLSLVEKKHVCTVTRRLSVATEGATYKRLLFQFRCNCDNGTLVFMKIRS